MKGKGVGNKVWQNILNKLISKWLEEKSKLAGEQNGYHKDRNCIDHLFVLNSIIDKSTKDNQNTFDWLY